LSVNGSVVTQYQLKGSSINGNNDTDLIVKTYHTVYASVLNVFGKEVGFAFACVVFLTVAWEARALV